MRLKILIMNGELGVMTNSDLSKYENIINLFNQCSKKYVTLKQLYYRKDEFIDELDKTIINHRIKNLIDVLTNDLVEVYTYLDTMNDYKITNILELRLIKGMSISEVMNETGYSNVHVYTLLNEGLQRLSEEQGFSEKNILSLRTDMNEMEAYISELNLIKEK